MMNSPNVKVLFAAAELAPYTKVGGLADVAAGLTKALWQLGHDVRLITPKHPFKSHPQDFSSAVIGSFELPFWGVPEPVVIHQAELPGHGPLYLVENQHFFSRERVYGEADDLARYLFFTQVVLEAPKRLHWQPDIIHSNDWHTAAVPYALSTLRGRDDFYRPCASVLTIHNLHHKGPDRLTNVLLQGIYYADVINTVSPTYAQEILTAEYGEGLEHLLRLRREHLEGILNGLDYEEVNPAADPHLAANYDISQIHRRLANKTALQRQCRLEEDATAPLVGIVSRLASQKGIDLVLAVADQLFAQTPVQLVILGLGDEVYHRQLKDLEARYPQRVAVVLSFSLPLASLIYGGCDLFLMPSRFEPCGLGQLIALRYGAVPVVRRTGGLADTIIDVEENPDRGNGFVFVEYQPEALLQCLLRALRFYATDKAQWQQLMIRGMEMDFSWTASAQQYLRLYQKASRLRRMINQAV